MIQLPYVCSSPVYRLYKNRKQRKAMDKFEFTFNQRGNAIYQAIMRYNSISNYYIPIVFCSFIKKNLPEFTYCI